MSRAGGKFFLASLGKINRPGAHDERARKRTFRVLLGGGGDGK